MKQLIIDHNHENQRVDKYLKKLLVNAPSGFVYKMLRKKDVKVNGEKIKENYILKYGDKVELFLYDDRFNQYTSYQDIKNIPITFQVAYEDEHILVVNKPAGLLVQGDSNEKENTLDKQVLAYLHQKGEYDPKRDLGFTPGPVHRLDRNTSGLVIFGKDMRALQDLNEMMKKRHCIDKTYLTIVKGKVNDIELKDYVKKDEAKGKMILCSENDPDALFMHTLVENVKTKNQISLVKVKIITGRTHQIRVHLASINHPVLGDRKYGDFKWNQEMNQIIHCPYQYLHAYSLTFINPFGSLSYLKNKTIYSKLDKKEKEIIEKLFEMPFIKEDYYI